ncbi:glycerophosphodiester phosphodiesterase family protein [Nocardia sp. NPDC046473]|uniref:glycerophosphodiester phosphodiesterase family protein n=1 Tax=Nocardia sp. NPDC046473 TaxID=3155733 RepID=UPI0033C11F27
MRRTGAVGVAALLLSGVLNVGAASAGGPLAQFDLQAHRGGAALVVENTLASFTNALELGVRTLELDVQITEDGFPVVTHDRDPSPDKCIDTAAAFPGDPKFPYVPGTRFIRDLTLAQVRTIDCGSKRLAAFPDQQTVPGARMPLLSEVFDLVHAYHADDVMLNVESKVEAGAPEQTAPREQFVQVIAAEVHRAHLEKQVTIQSFDWGSLMRMREVAPELPLVALTNGQQFLQEGRPGASPWLGGIDIDDFQGSLQEKFVSAAASFGADAVSPVHGDPQDGSIEDPGYQPFTTAGLVRAAHQRGIRVVPWTVDDRATMTAMIDLGVDGLITNRPDLLRTILAERGYQLPKAYHRP